MLRYKKARLLQGEIDLYGQSVRVSEAIIDKGDYRYYPGSGNNEAEPEENDADTIVSLPWTVQIQKLRLHRNQALYALPTRIPQKGSTSGIFLSIILRLPSTPSIIEEAKYAFLSNNWRSPNVRG